MSVTHFGFGVGSVDSTRVQTRDLRVDPSGRLVVFGVDDRDEKLVVTRLNADGSGDASFGRVFAGDGFANIFRPEGMALQSDGGIIVGALRVDQNIRADEQSELLRLQPGGTTAGPITLAGGTLSITGTSASEAIIARSGDSTDGAETTLASLDGIGHVFDASDVSMLSVVAGAGDDFVLLNGLTQPASVSGGDGHDRILGGFGNDSLSGNAGVDWIEAGSGDDRLAGNGAKDLLGAGEGNDRLHGGAGNDTLAGQSGDDTLKGGGGDDIIIGGDDADFLHGDAGDDFLSAGTYLTTEMFTAVDTLFGDSGQDGGVAGVEDMVSDVEKLSRPGDAVELP